jgi:hypothetical protein
MTAEPQQATLAGARLLAEFQSYDGLIDALRARARERRIAVGSAEFAAVAGLPDRYATKLLGPGKVKRLGPVSLGPILECLGTRLALLEDADAMERLAGRIPTTDEKRLRARSTTFTLSGHFLKKRARLGGLAKAAVHRDKIERRGRWRIAKSKQRAAKRGQAIELNPRPSREHDALRF